MVVSESRSELLQWLNHTLDLNYTKVEQCGTGAAFCQLLDSIVGGIPISKVKFQDVGNNEYNYRQNWKILQAGFNKHKINKNIDVERLIKCRLQDNLDLLQWFRKFWLDNKKINDVEYDAKAIRSTRRISDGNSSNSNSNNNEPRRVTSSSSSSSGSNTSSTSTTRKSITNSSSLNIPKNNASISRRISSGNLSSTNNNNHHSRSITPLTPSNLANQAHSTTSTKSSQLQKELQESIQEISYLNDELKQYKLSSDSLETERNFYFNKLREIEILIQNILDDGENYDQSLTVPNLAQQIQSILYSTEPGFQVTDPMADDKTPINHNHTTNDDAMNDDINGMNNSVIIHHHQRHSHVNEQDIDILDSESF
ncbi:calponin homology domain-containing protein [Scheffersomyces coipomensis]|uniref:calponin homology domain-containing protein n=1 Tax=Scheffersomyces coipomensis TaxID=1788519 RepID=UPI00315D574A